MVGGTWPQPLPAGHRPPRCSLLLIVTLPGSLPKATFLPCPLTVPSPQLSRWGRRNQPINMNHYANKKSAAESMLDIALLMANASQLKAVVEQGPTFAFFVPLVVLISISLALQIGVGVLLIFLGRSLALSSQHGPPPCTPGSHRADPPPALLRRAHDPGFDPDPAL